MYYCFTLTSIALLYLCAVSSASSLFHIGLCVVPSIISVQVTVTSYSGCLLFYCLSWTNNCVQIVFMASRKGFSHLKLEGNSSAVALGIGMECKSCFAKLSNINVITHCDTGLDVKV